jgi:hypothetical protein
MAVIHCGGGLSTSWKTKAQALKWLKAANKIPCVGPCSEATEPCYRTGSLGQGYPGKGPWYATVLCPCGPPQVSGKVGAVIEWIQVRPTRKRASRQRIK